MKTLQFSVVHRLIVSGWLNEAGRSSGQTLSDLSKMLKLVDKLVFTEEENEQFQVKIENRKDAEGNEIRDAKTGNVVQQMAWKSKDEAGNDIDIKKEFELSDEQVTILKDLIKAKDERKEFNFEGMSVVAEIAEQVGYSF